PGKGTTFIIYLPVNAVKKTNNLSQKIDSTRRIKPKLHALVVDDEDTIRKFVNGVLTDAGLKVIEAKDGNEAIEIFKTSHNNIDLVILDMIMPGIKGDKVLKEMRKICNDTKIIVASGFMSERQRESLKEEHVDAFLNKPFTDKNLIRTICSLPDLSC
ncbi:MAG TPA: response regulator, partial [Syntrophorhabdaceae bacterium]|nr:response regulator [Syntrophorhabdaceae bacterium]